MGSIGEPDPPIFPLPQQHHASPSVTLNGYPHPEDPVEELTTPILIVGGGPVGMLLSYTLSHHHNQPCTLIEPSLTTTQYPKMEYTNPRSMEIYKQLGLANQLREIGVPERYSLDEIITTGLADGCKPITRWERPSPEEVRRRSHECNDGTWPREPYLRCSQILVEKWLKGLVQNEEAVQSMFGWKLVGMKEDDDGVVSEIISNEGRRMRIRSQYVVGCDGGGSLVRKIMGVKAERKNLGMTFLFVHIRSKDPRLQSQGQFWHLMTLNGLVLVNQDEKDTYTWHFAMPEDTDLKTFDAEKAILEGVGGLLGPCPLEIDEIKVKSTWKSQLAVADRFTSEQGRVFLAGDAAHQLSPIGGHGLNSGIGDLWDLSWKLSAVLKGWGGEALLESYDAERRPVALHNQAMVEKASLEVILPLFTAKEKYGVEALLAENEEGTEARKDFDELLKTGHWLHNQNGTFLAYRYSNSEIVVQEKGVVEPVREVDKYPPTTLIGGRPPHVWLKDGVTSIFDLLGRGFNVVDFTSTGEVGETFLEAAKEAGVPLASVHLPDEQRVRELWERDVVLLRPDGHVAWRVSEDWETVTEEQIREVLEVVSGNRH